jgi:NTP pyrophosphatase (non-canonical NTP hydrolase)
MTPLSFDDYQVRAARTAVYPRDGAILGFVYCALGVNGEAGEVAEHAKKALRDDHGSLSHDRLQKIKKELGDVLWYVANAAGEAGFSLEDIAASNLRKLADRQERNALRGAGDDR